MRAAGASRARSRLGGALAACLAALVLLPGTAPAGGYAFRLEPARLDSGLHDGDPAGTRAVYATTVRAPGAAVVRVRLAGAELGRASFLVIRSLADGDEQRLDAADLPAWGMTSAIFAGEAAEVTLHVAPEDKGVFVRIAGALGSPAPPVVDTQCGTTDDRVATTDNRVGRLNGNCTAWRIGNGAFLTAGHCADADPDQGGPLLPDGVLDLTNASIVEFNVPLSPNGTSTNPADADDQYPVVATSVQWAFAGNGLSNGNDWCVFRVGPNANTNLLPHQVYGLPFRITRELPAVGQDLRLTGFGSDTDTANQTNQTSTGPFQGEAGTRLDHRVDSEGGNSGGPLIWEANQFCIGLHTTGGCTTTGGSNSGTSFELDALENAINAAPGTGTIHVDSGHTLVIQQEGSLLRPIWTLAGGISTVASGGRLSVYAGNYTLSAGTVLSKPMIIEAPVGTVGITTP